MSDRTISYTTKSCVMCGLAAKLDLPEAGYIAWAVNGAHVQEAFPELTADVREQLISGTHGPCWDNLFADEIEDAGAECRCSTPCHDADVGVGVITCMPQHCPVHGGQE